MLIPAADRGANNEASIPVKENLGAFYSSIDLFSQRIFAAYHLEQTMKAQNPFECRKKLLLVPIA